MSEASPAATRPAGVLAAMCLTQAAILLDVTIVNVALPDIQRDLGLSSGSLVWVVSAYTLALAALVPASGTLGDRYGRKRVMLLGLTVFVTASALCALSGNDIALVAARALQGVGGAMMAALTLSILTSAFPPHRRAAAIGLWTATAGIGFGLGPVIGGFLLSVSGWSSIFWVSVPLGATAFLLTMIFVGESRDPQARPLDVVGAVLVGSGLLFITFGLTQSGNAGWDSPSVGGSLAGGAALLGLFVLWERRVRIPLLPRALWHDVMFVGSNLAFVLLYLAFTGMFLFISLYFQDVRGWSALATGLSWLTMNAPFLLISLLISKLIRRFGAHRLVLTGVLIAAAGMASFAVLTADGSVVPAFVGYLLVGVGFGAATPALSAEAMSRVPADSAGVGSAALNSGRQIGSSVGLALLGAVAATVAGIPPGGSYLAAGTGPFIAGMRAAMIVASAVLLLAGVVLVLADRAVRRRAATAATLSQALKREHDDDHQAAGVPPAAP
ncbi:MAG: MFS transporter [Actinomycetota bacterium]|nr:MAG: MFS transporter [Actinomycetota bacterium]